MAAKTKDIRTYVPINNKKVFCLDTNTLYWYCYPRYSNIISSRRKNEIRPYYEFIDKLVQNGNTIITSIYNVSEFLNVIEKNECDIYQQMNPGMPIHIKDLRKMPEERKKLRQIMNVALNNVRSICKVVGFEISFSHLEYFVHELENHECDLFDYIIIKDHLDNERWSIVTDDGDFFSVDNVEIYTANEKML